MRSRVLKFHNDNSPDTEKHKTTLEFQPPQVFQSGAEIGLISSNIYNAVYSISDREPSKNELFLLCTDVDTAGDIPAVSTDSRLEIFTNTLNTNERLYKITFTNGVYDVEAIDLYVASLMNDFVNGSFIDYTSRNIVISPDYSSGKFKIEFASGKFDLVFREDYITSENLEYLIGCDISKAPIYNPANLEGYLYDFQNGAYNANKNTTFLGLKKYKNIIYDYRGI